MKKIIILRHTHIPDVQMMSDIVIYNGSNKIFQCRAIEQPWRNNASRTSCIPAGTYRAVLEYSSRFQTNLYELKKVTGRAEIKFHVANYARQLEGCIAPGRAFADLDADGYLDVTDSRNTLVAMHNAILPDKEVEVVVVDMYS